MEKDTDTNFGWWADKPQRSDRANMKSHWNGLVSERKLDAARALADLMLVGSATLEKHGVRDQLIGEAFEAFVMAMASTCGPGGPATRCGS